VFNYEQIDFYLDWRHSEHNPINGIATVQQRHQVLHQTHKHHFTIKKITCLWEGIVQLPDIDKNAWILEDLNFSRLQFLSTSALCVTMLHSGLLAHQSSILWLCSIWNIFLAMPLNPIDGYLKTATGFQATVFATQAIVQIRHVELNFYYIMKVESG